MPGIVISIIMFLGGLAALGNGAMPAPARTAMATGRICGAILYWATYLGLAPFIVDQQHQQYKHVWLIPVPYLCLIGGEVYARLVSQRKIEAMNLRRVPFEQKADEKESSP